MHIAHHHRYHACLTVLMSFKSPRHLHVVTVVRRDKIGTYE